MWYFTWMLGIGFAVMISILNAMWGEFEQDRDDHQREELDRNEHGREDVG